MIKALILQGGDYHPFETCAGMLQSTLQTTNRAACTITTDRNALLDLSNYQVVILYVQGGALTDAQEQSLCDFVANGGGVVGIHCAADAFTKNKLYMEMIGSKFAGHGPVTEFTVNLSDANHAVMQGVHEFRVTDEFYILEKTTKADLHWLCSGHWQSGLHPLAYTRAYKKGRVFYTALGHDERAFRHPMFQRMVRRAVTWAANVPAPKPVRFGVVGYGGSFSMGKFHAEAVGKTPGLELTAICEIDEARRKTAHEEFPQATLCASVDELIKSKQVDAAVIVTPHNTHAPIALDLLNAGVGVVCEKPFCITVDEATQMIDAARKHNVLLTAFHNRRWDADYLAIKDIIAKGLLGDVFQIEAYMGDYKHPGYWWRSHKPVSGGAIYDWGAHFVDWMLNLMQPHAMESVNGFFTKSVWHDVTNEDHCRASIRFAGNRTASLEISSLAAVHKPKWRILGTKGGLTSGWEPPIKVTTYVSGREEKRELPFIEGSWNDYYLGVADHLRDGEPLHVTPESARRVIAVLNLAEIAAKTGQPQPVPFEKND